jgi:hypothetical protein
LAESRSGVRRKQRTREERTMLEHSALAAIKWQEEQGGLERTGPRDYVLHPRRREPRAAALRYNAGSASKHPLKGI